MIRLLGTLLSALALSSCDRGGVELFVENQSAVELEAVQASGPGFSAYVGDLAPGKRKELRVYPRGEADVALRFTANGRTITSPAMGYFERGYSVSAIVTRDLNVTVDSGQH
jgi:hypothetical protein